MVKIFGDVTDLDPDLGSAIKDHNLVTIKQIVQTKQIDLTKDLQSARAVDSTYNYLHYAISVNTSHEIIEYLCQQGSNVNARFFLPSIGRGRYTPMELLLIYDEQPSSEKIFTTLFAYGAKLFRAGYQESSLLDYFLRHKKIELYEIARATVDPQTLTIKEKELLSTAVAERNLETIKFFVETKKFTAETILNDYGLRDKYEKLSRVFQYLNDHQQRPASRLNRCMFW